jgi:hypothetical protein
MEPKDLRFGGGTLDTSLSPLIAVLMVVFIILILRLPRKYAAASLLVGIFAIPIGQVLVLAGAHFMVMRILIVAGLARWIVTGRKEPGGIFAGGVNEIDRAFVFFALAGLVTFSLEWLTLPALVKSSGTLLDTLGGYCVLRSLIRDKEDVKSTIKVLAILSFVLGICMVAEQIFHSNIFASLGGGGGHLAQRAGKIRSQATFETYLTAGAFGATLIPLLAWLWTDKKSRKIAYVGFAGATLMTVTTNSSTPVLAYLAGVMALSFWRFRNRMYMFRWILFLGLIGMQVVMKAPVWALIARVDLTGSSSGYHRFMLVDNFLRHFLDWWLVGYKDYNTWGWDMWDLSNQFVAYGLTGGLVTLVLFIACISLSFSNLGRARKVAEQRGDDAWLFWCLGSCLFAHLANFFGVSYFDQVQFVWFTLLAIISISIDVTIRQPVSKVITTWESWAAENISYSDRTAIDTQNAESSDPEWSNSLLSSKSCKAQRTACELPITRSDYTGL